ncbi:uncharacterized protein RHIMIDRAFT_79675 [Rhizopus microsporus ATCC 52813]|uniref:Uncharacterized protein n=1 Tax=Rhizopus microsporus ATCC 52813 TaxID=1340429 RepID=A0A2G4SI01_RHIZD|nr:uncharacterized protein RHIMIDRAFT_79675 [Rhizopus microsporus ATCC 52813]PHZ08016.1 hypothetical protein RHIMIDRAFT_79675 [Rhizopus microsporus ATCC 52813]
MMRTVTIKQQQQMTKEIEEQLGNGRFNYLRVVYPKDSNIHTQERILENSFISHKIDGRFFSLFLPTNKSGKARINSKGEMKV